MNIFDLLSMNRQKPDPTRGTGHVFNPYGKNTAPRPRQSGNWMDKPALGGSMSRGDLLLASMGMLSGRNFQEGMGNAAQYMAYGMDKASERQKEAAQKAAMQKALSGMDLTPEQRALAGVNPTGVLGAVTERAFAAPAGPLEINGQLVDPKTYQVLGDYRTPETPDAPDWVRDTLADGVYEWIPGQPNSLRKVGDAPVKAGANAPDATAEGVIRREYMSATRGFRDVQDAYQRIKVTDTSTAAGQMSLIFQYMKMLDPGSTVREGEYATAQNTTGVPGQVINAYNRALEGKFLTPDQVADFERQADQLYQGALSGYQNMRNRYTNDIVPGYPGMDVGRVIPDFAMDGLAAPSNTPPPEPRPTEASNLSPEEQAEFERLKSELDPETLRMLGIE